MAAIIYLSRSLVTVSVSMSTKSVSSQTAGAVKGDESVTGERGESGYLETSRGRLG